MSMNDPRERYRVEFDRALERGEVTPEALAKGKSEPWDSYLRAAELCVRAPEEWELERPIAWGCERFQSGERVRVVFSITNEALARCTALQAIALLDQHRRVAIRQIAAVGVPAGEITFRELGHHPLRDETQWLVEGVIPGPLRPGIRLA